MKKVLSVVLSVFLLLGVMPFAANAAETVAGGFCGADGENITWRLNDEGLLVISGSGKMANYEWNGSPWFSNGAVTTVEVKNGVKSLGDYAFNGCVGLSRVILPDSVSSVGKYAFYGCTGLEEITMPESVSAIGSGAFYGCSALSEILIPDGVATVASYTFYDCKALREIVLSRELKSIGGAAFAGCASLTEADVPKGVTTIGSEAFSGCTGLTGITIPNSVLSVGRRAFYGCSSLLHVAFGSGASVIGEEMFAGCTALTDIVLPDGLALIGASAFAGCEGLTAIGFPGGLTIIGASAFAGCTGLTNITLPEGFVSLGDQAFDGCAALTGMIVPADTAEIGTDAIPPHTLIYGTEDTFAQHWAAENGRAFSTRQTAKLTLTAPSVVCRPFVGVCGFAAPGAVVTVLVNDSQAASVRASANGKWNASLALDGAADGDSFTIKASVTSDGNTLTRTASVRYRSGAPTFLSLTMEHNDYAVELTADDLNAAKRNVTLAPGKPFFFKVAVTNSKNVESLSVSSTKNGVVKTLPLAYDANFDCWFADGLFDAEDQAYVPGTLTVTGIDKAGNAFNAGVSIKLNFLLTPAGYAYEAVRSNKLEGVSSAVYNRDEAGNETLWNAEGAEQFNPVSTLRDGSFSWAVSKGTWQIRLEKEGYLPAASEWMTVPPAHDQVVLPMVTTKAPEVLSLSVYPDCAEITFSSYMDIGSVNEQTMVFEGYIGGIAPLDAEETEEGSGVFYAKTFRFTPAVPFIGKVRAVVSGVKNYAGIALAEDYTAVIDVAVRPDRFTATDAVAVCYGSAAEITVQAENAAGRTVSVAADSGIVVLSDDTLTLDENGSAVLTVSGRMTGTVQIVFSLGGTALTAATTATVTLSQPNVLPGDVDGDGKVLPGDARLALRMAVKLEPCEEGTAAFAAADVTRDGAVAPDDARLILRAAVGLEQL